MAEINFMDKLSHYVGNRKLSHMAGFIAADTHFIAHEIGHNIVIQQIVKTFFPERQKEVLCRIDLSNIAVPTQVCDVPAQIANFIAKRPDQDLIYSGSGYVGGLGFSAILMLIGSRLSSSTDNKVRNIGIIIYDTGAAGTLLGIASIIDPTISLFTHSMSDAQYMIKDLIQLGMPPELANALPILAAGILSFGLLRSAVKQVKRVSYRDNASLTELYTS